MRFMKVSGWSKDGNIEFTDIVLPAKRIVCPRCDGSGKHVNPAIDGHGLTHEDFVNDPDFTESYFGGVYDITCELCQGNNVIDEIDENLCKTRISWWKGMIRYYNGLQQDSDARMESYYERMVGEAAWVCEQLETFGQQWLSQLPFQVRNAIRQVALARAEGKEVDTPKPIPHFPCPDCEEYVGHAPGCENAK